MYYMCCFFFFNQKTAVEMRIRYWSSDVCSSDLVLCARPDAHDPLVHSGESRAAIAIDGKARHRRAPSRVESRQASDAAVLLPTLREAAHDDLIDIVGVQAVARLERAEHRREDALDRKSTRLNSSH